MHVVFRMDVSSIFLGFWPRFGRVLVWFGDQRLGNQGSKKQFKIELRFLKPLAWVWGGLGRVWGGFWEGLGTVLEGFWQVLGGLGAVRESQSREATMIRTTRDERREKREEKKEEKRWRRRNRRRRRNSLGRIRRRRKRKRRRTTRTRTRGKIRNEK